MKIKDGFILREVAGNYIVVAVGSRVKTFNGVINLNETGAFLWRELEKGGDKESLVKAVLDEYETTEEEAKKGVDAFVENLTKANLLD